MILPPNIIAGPNRPNKLDIPPVLPVKLVKALDAPVDDEAALDDDDPDEVAPDRRLASPPPDDGVDEDDPEFPLLPNIAESIIISVKL